MRFVARIFVFIFLITGCNKSTNNSVGLEIQPNSDMSSVIETDTMKVFAYTQSVSAVTSYSKRFTKFIGEYLDPNFGFSDVSLFCNFSIPNNQTNVNFGSNLVVDSAAVILRCLNPYIGDTLGTMKYLVNEITSTYSNTAVFTTSTSIGVSTLPLNSIFKFTTVNALYCLKIPIDKNYALQIITNTTNLVSNAEFQSAYKGFCISSDRVNLNQVGNIRSFDCNSAISGLSIYYRNNTAPTSTSTPILFPFTGTNIKRLSFNNVSRLYTNSTNFSFLNQINNQDTLQGNQNLFIQGFGATRLRIYIPYLQNFTKLAPIAVSKASFIIKVDPSFSSIYYAPPEKLTLIGCDAAGNESESIDDLSSLDFAKYDGSYDAINKQYTFNISRYIQQIITGKQKNYGFYIVNASPSNLNDNDVQANNVILGGVKNLLLKPQLKITYVQYKN